MPEIVTERDTTKTYSGLPAPQDWHIIGHREDGLMWERLVGQRITVIESIAVQGGKRWLHVSVAKPNKAMPTWEDLHVARKLFIGEERECYQIFPPKERYVNLYNVLHLFCCLEQEAGVLPQFDKMVQFGEKAIRCI